MGKVELSRKGFVLLKEEKAASDFGAVYMILVFAIVALLLVVLVKPMFQNAQKNVPKSAPTPKTS